MDLPSNAVLQQDAPENLGDSVDPFIASLVNSQLVVDAGALGNATQILTYLDAAIDPNRSRQLCVAFLCPSKGSDSEGRTILVLYSCYLPDPDTCDYDCLLRALVHRLEKYVETDYILVIFATGSRHRPSMVWMLKAYQQLERKLSVKIIGAHSNRSMVVIFLFTSVKQLSGLETEGLFRISPSQQFVNALHDMYDSGEVTIDIASNGGVHSAAGLLKMFFRELPEPIIPGEMYDTFRMIQSNPESAHATFAKTVLLPILPQSAQILLRALFHMLHTLHLNKDTTLMPAANLAIVWAPNFVRSTNPMVDLGMCTLGPTGGGVGTFVRVAIEEWDEVFGNTFENFDDGIFVDEDQLKPVADSSETESGPASGSSRPSSGNSALGENRRQGSKAPSQLAKEYTSDTDSDEISSMNFSLSRHDGSGSGSGRSTSVRNSASYDPSRSTVPLATPEEYVSDASGVVRTRTRTIRGKANRGTIVAAEDSSLAMLGAGLSQTTLADASRVGFGGGEKLSLA
ncbi:hypothetical protein HDU84_007769 [Entophlyctis sp. JEL0112]|nr:hypothetical protein HDU84_007769 [Entophlyctis sp. JEL0112]